MNNKLLFTVYFAFYLITGVSDRFRLGRLQVERDFDENFFIGVENIRRDSIRDLFYS